MNTWQAPSTPTPVRADVVIPGSKSQTNRALVLAALATPQGTSTVSGALRSRDTDLMIGALRTLGVSLDGAGTELSVSGRISPAAGAHVDCGLAGTVLRFVPPVAAMGGAAVTFDGDDQARSRPIAPLLRALRALGVGIDGDAMPFVVHGTGSVAGGIVHIDASASSQFVSGLLLSGATFTEGLTVVHTGGQERSDSGDVTGGQERSDSGDVTGGQERSDSGDVTGGPIPSAPHVAMTVSMLRAAGVTVDDETPNRWHVRPGPIAARHWAIEPDLSNAVPFLAAAVVSGGTVRIADWPRVSVQPAGTIVDLLSTVGSMVRQEDSFLEATGPDGYDGFDADLHDVGELAPSVAALAALATPGSVSRLSGIAHLRGHETDRLAALTAELTGLGGHCVETADGLTITATPLHGGRWRSYADHRMATAGAIVGLRVPGVEVEDIGTTAKTLPDFPRMWTDMVAGPVQGRATSEADRS